MVGHQLGRTRLEKDTSWKRHDLERTRVGRTRVGRTRLGKDTSLRVTAATTTTISVVAQKPIFVHGCLKHYVPVVATCQTFGSLKRWLRNTLCQKGLPPKEGKCYAGKSQLLFSANEIWGKTTTALSVCVHCIPLP